MTLTPNQMSSAEGMAARIHEIGAIAEIVEEGGIGDAHTRSHFQGLDRGVAQGKSVAKKQAPGSPIVEGLTVTYRETCVGKNLHQSPRKAKKALFPGVREERQRLLRNATAKVILGNLKSAFLLKSAF